MQKLSIFASFLMLVCFSANAQNKPDSTAKDTVSNRIFTQVESPAKFPGGSNGWKQYLETNLNYPKKAFKKKIEGEVRVQFIVDREGNISEVAALNDPGGGLAEEAIRIIQQSPKWKPAEQNHRKVIYRHIQSITFKLN
jgi:protein TonB